ncbi:MAG TPA: two-component regulator propeller domain-containing protein, partial [Rhodothermia bacterium]|nr:two-component regulator propeller domain-containing protein [Rhodothermia bacterium]
MGTNGKGVTRFNPGAVGFEHIRSSPGNPMSLQGPFVWAIHESRDGLLWVSTAGGGQPTLTAVDRSSGRYRHYRHDPGDPQSIPPGQVSAIIEDRNGLIWITPRALASLNPVTGRARTYDIDPEADGPIPRTLTEDQLGNLWIGTGNGVFRMDPDRPGEFTAFYRSPEGSRRGEHSTQFIMEDLAGFIWLGMENSGLVRLDPQSGKTTGWRHNPKDPGSLTNNTVTSIAERRREPGILWATTAAGLNRFDTKSGTFRYFTDRDGLPNNFIYSALEDEQGRLWMSTNQGISRFDPENETFRNYGLEIGLQDLEFNSGAFHKSRNGELFFGGVDGLNAFFPNELSENLNAPTVALVDLKLFNKSIRETDAVRLEKPLTDTEELRLDYTQSDLTFDFVALHYVDPGKNEFAYMLEGHDDDWVYIGRQRSATFTNLEPGEYVFRVKAANSDGVWNEEGTSIHIVIDPPFWQTWWFRILAVFGVAGVLFGGFRLRVRQIESHNRMLEAEVDKRTVQLRESNEQLEQSATIVEAINQETSFRRLLTKILEEARVIPGVEKATALVYMPAEEVFRVRATFGWDVEAMQEIRLTSDQARMRYVEQADHVAEDIFVAKDVAHRSGSEQLADFGHVASFLVLRVRIEEEVVAYLVFDNLNDKDAFDRRDVELLERLREHIRSAFIKTRILEDLQT